MVRWPNPKNLRLPRMKAARLAAARARHIAKPADKKHTAWEFGEFYWNRSATLFRNVLAILVVGFGAYILYQSVIPKVISIAPIAVPEDLAKNGFTADVAAERLEDALNDIVTRAHSVRKGPDVARQADLPSIVVPSTSLSIEALAAQIRRFLRIESRSNVSGEITTVDDKLWLRLRMNGQDLFVSAKGVGPKHPGDLFAAAAEQIFEKTDPYILAASLSDTEPDKCLEKAKRIIDLPPTDPMAAWAHTFVVGFLLDKMGLLDHSVAWAHTLVGYVLRDKQHNDNDTAILEYRLAIELDPWQTVHHNNLGVALRDQSKTEEAIAEYKKAIDLDPRFAMAHNNLGVALYNQHNTDEAVVEYRKAIELDPSYANAHRNLSIALRKQGKNEAADAELKKALDLEQKP
jgi:Tfp pilus assembly protein PilF